MQEFPSPRDDKTLIDIRATISAELTGAEVCNGRRTRGGGGGGKSIDSTKVYRINSTAHLINSDFRRERSVYKRGHATSAAVAGESRVRRVVCETTAIISEGAERRNRSTSNAPRRSRSRNQPFIKTARRCAASPPRPPIG